MEATALSIGKSVLSGAISSAKSAVADEVALQLGVHRDKVFIADELEMMQSFLMVAHEERDDHNKVINTWVKQVRDVAYDVEDGLQDFVVRLGKQKKSWWRIPRRLLDRHNVASQMKELRTKVEDVSQRNLRYGLIKGSSSIEPAATAADMFGVEEARHAAKQHQTRLDLAQLVNKEGDDLGVIGVWGTSGSVGHTSIISEAYGNANVKLNFPCRAWVRVTRPFHPKELVCSIVKQFRATTVGVVEILLELEVEKAGHEMAREYGGYVNEKRYLIVLTGLSTIEEWHQIKTYFPENKLGSRIIVSTEQVEVASLCSGQESTALELKQLSADQTLYAFYQQSSEDVGSSSMHASSSKLPYTPENEIQEDQSNTVADGKLRVQERLTRNNTMIGVLEEFQLIGREREKFDIIQLITEQASTQQFEVIALWGMGGLGKTSLIKDVYQREEVTTMFGKYAFVTVLRPFNLAELLRSLASQLGARNEAMDFVGDNKKDISSMGVEELTKLLGRRSQGNSCLFVLDDLSSAAEWDKILPCLHEMEIPNLVIVITTRRVDIAKHCCKKLKCIRLLNGLEEKDSYNLFTKKIFKNKTTDLAKHYPELVEPAKLILKKCNGLPLAIVTIGGFLADQPSKTVVEWRKLNDHISAELEMNPMLEPIKTVLMKSYDGLPYYLKACFLYLSIFPEDHKINLRRLVHRWIAEGYSREVRDKSAMEIAERYFVELIERSMILPTQQSVFSRKGIDSCQLHDLIRDISVSKSMQENLVFRLEEGCSLDTHGAVRHLSISSNWEGDECEFENTLELSRIRSLTVFGKCRPFYISYKMRFLRVLDLEGTYGLHDHDLEHIGKLIHLRYFSLRRSQDIDHLPDSVGNLRQLEKLDIKGTSISALPKSITKLRKLRYLHAGTFNSGVKVPRGITELKTLHTLRSVDLTKGNAVVHEIKGLTNLRKLAVSGINTKNGLVFCSAISSTLRSLESLSVESHVADLYDCLHTIDMSSPPENLQSLKLTGDMSKLPEFIRGLKNLVKLKIQASGGSRISEIMQVLGNLPSLSILRFRDVGFEGPMTFPRGLFRSLVVLEVAYLEIESLEFEPASMQKLEVLSVQFSGSRTSLSGLEFLPAIKEVRVDKVFFPGLNEQKEKEDMSKEEVQKEAKRRVDKVKEDLGKQLASNKNRPILKVAE